MWVTVAFNANHGLTKLKRFLSRFLTKLCNYFIFYLRLMFHICIQRFDMMDENYVSGKLNMPKSRTLDTGRPTPTNLLYMLT